MNRDRIRQMVQLQLRLRAQSRRCKRWLAVAYTCMALSLSGLIVAVFRLDPWWWPVAQSGAGLVGWVLVQRPVQAALTELERQCAEVKDFATGLLAEVPEGTMP